MKTYWGVHVQDIHILTSALVGGKWSSSRPGRFTPGEGTPLCIKYEAGWAPKPVWIMWREEVSCPYRNSNSDPSAVQPMASRGGSSILKFCGVTYLKNVERLLLGLYSYLVASRIT
jgi:hypothetical protein